LIFFEVFGALLFTNGKYILIFVANQTKKRINDEQFMIKKKLIIYLIMTLSSLSQTTIIIK